MTERNNGYFETSFLPGREFASPTDFNEQLGLWLPKANTRTVRSLHGRPADFLEQDLAAMTVLPPVPPAVGLTGRVRLARDYYVRVDGNDYSADPSAIGRHVDFATVFDVPASVAPGPSPLARGTHDIRGAGFDGGGTIPARAGNTRSGWRLSSRMWDHPRSRGEHLALDLYPGRGPGPSPLARGTRDRATRI